MVPAVGHGVSNIICWVFDPKPFQLHLVMKTQSDQSRGWGVPQDNRPGALHAHATKDEGLV